jgi:putative transposase
MADVRKSKFSEEQIIGFLKQAEAGMRVAEICRKGGFSDATLYKWRSKFGGMEASDAQRLREREAICRMVEEHHLSERRACRLAGLSRDS